MIIHEEEFEHDHKFKIKKVKYKSDGTDDKVLEPLENGASFVLFNGKPKSGKTTVMLSWLTKRAYYLKRFHTVFVYSPSLLSGSLEDDHPLLELPEEQLRTELTLEELQGDIAKIYGKKKRVLFIFDDVQQSLKGAVQNEVAKLCFNRRHLCKGGISCWMSSQVYNQIPLKIRKCLSSILLFPTRQAKERETIREEVADFLDKDEWSELLKYTFDDPHNFLYIKCNLEPKDMFFKNYCPLNLELEDE